MLKSTEAQTGNALLDKMAKADAELLKPFLEPIDLQLGEELYEAHQPLDYAYFLLSGICSIIAENGEGVRIETGLIGREGLIGIPVIHYAEKAPSTALVASRRPGLTLGSLSASQRFSVEPLTV